MVGTKKFLQDNNVPASKILSYTLGDFTGGIRNVGDMTDREAIDIKNMVFTDGVAMEKRTGYMNSMLCPTMPSNIDWFDWYKPYYSDSILLVGAGNKMYKVVSGVYTEISTCISTVLQGVTFFGKYYFVDGDKFRVFDGEKVYEISSPQSYQVDTLTIPNGTITTAGTANIIVTLSGLSGSPLTVPVSVALGMNQVDVANACRNALMANTAILDKLIVDGTGSNIILTKLIAEANDATFNIAYAIGTSVGISAVSTSANTVIGSTFTPRANPATKGVSKFDIVTKSAKYEPCAYEISDVSLGANIVPLSPKYITVRKNRLYLSGSSSNANFVYISDIENGLYFPTLLAVQPPPDGDAVNGLKVFQDTLIISKRNSMHVLYGNSNRSSTTDPFILKQMTTHTGCRSGRTMTIMNNFLVYLGSDKRVYRMITPLTDVRQLTTAVLSEKIDLTLMPFNIDTIDSMQDYQISAFFYRDTLYLTIGNDVLTYNYNFQSWARFTGVVMRNCMVYNDRMLFSVSGKNLIYRFKAYDPDLSEGDTQDKKDEVLNAFSDGDIGELVAIEAEYITRRMDFGVPTYFKFFRDIYVISKTYKFLTSKTDITFEIDYADMQNSFTSENSISVFGISKFGSRFISKDIVESLPSRLGRRGRTIALKINNKYINEPMKIIQVSGDYTLRGRR